MVAHVIQIASELNAIPSIAIVMIYSLVIAISIIAIGTVRTWNIAEIVAMQQTFRHHNKIETIVEAAGSATYAKAGRRGAGGLRVNIFKRVVVAPVARFMNRIQHNHGVGAV